MTPRSERCRPERILCLFVALFVLFGTQAVDVWHMRATYRSRVAERAAGKGPGAAPSASASAATPSPLRSFFSPPDAEEHRDATPAPHGPAASTTPPAPTTTTAAPAAPHTAPGAAPQAPRPGCEHPVAPLDQVTRWHNTSTVRFPSAHPEALCGRAAPTLLSGGALCTQEDICGYLKDVLVVLHINPQRFEWLEPLLEMAQAFAPHIMLVSIPALRDPDNDVTANMTSDDLRAHLSHMYLGPKRRYVHLVDTGVLAGMGDHNDIVMAMRLYPNFRGYLYWAQEDVLPGFWNFPRLDKEKPWYQEAGSYFSPSSLPRCPRKLYNKRKGGGRQSYKGRSCSIMRAKDMRDWKKLAPALDRIEREAPEDRAKVHPTYVPGINIYYVPRNMFVKFERYSAYFFHAEGYVEAVVVPLLQSAAAEGQGRETLRGLNVWPDKPGGRYHTVMEFQWANDFTHPVRATNDIMPRLRDVARRVQITAHLNSTTSEVLWDACYSCEQYPADGEYTQGRKGRYHSCSQGCSQPELSEPVSSRGGRVQITRNETHPEDEYPYEGFWNIESGRRLYQRIRNANRTDLIGGVRAMLAQARQRLDRVLQSIRDEENCSDSGSEEPSGSPPPSCGGDASAHSSSISSSRPAWHNTPTPVTPRASPPQEDSSSAGQHLDVRQRYSELLRKLEASRHAASPPLATPPPARGAPPGSHPAAVSEAHTARQGSVAIRAALDRWGSRTAQADTAARTPNTTRPPAATAATQQQQQHRHRQQRGSEARGARVPHQHHHHTPSPQPRHRQQGSEVEADSTHEGGSTGASRWDARGGEGGGAEEAGERFFDTPPSWQMQQQQQQPSPQPRHRPAAAPPPPPQHRHPAGEAGEILLLPLDAGEPLTHRRAAAAAHRLDESPLDSTVPGGGGGRAVTHHHHQHQQQQQQHTSRRAGVVSPPISPQQGYDATPLGAWVTPPRSQAEVQQQRRRRGSASASSLARLTDTSERDARRAELVRVREEEELLRSCTFAPQINARSRRQAPGGVAAAAARRGREGGGGGQARPTPAQQEEQEACTFAPAMSAGSRRIMGGRRHGAASVPRDNRATDPAEHTEAPQRRATSKHRSGGGGGGGGGAPSAAKRGKVASAAAAAGGGGRVPLQEVRLVRNLQDTEWGATEKSGGGGGGSAPVARVRGAAAGVGRTPGTPGTPEAGGGGGGGTTPTQPGSSGQMRQPASARARVVQSPEESQPRTPKSDSRGVGGASDWWAHAVQSQRTELWGTRV